MVCAWVLACAVVWGSEGAAWGLPKAVLWAGRGACALCVCFVHICVRGCGRVLFFCAPASARTRAGWGGCADECWTERGWVYVPEVPEPHAARPRARHATPLSRLACAASIQVAIPQYGSTAEAAAAHPLADVFINFASFRRRVCCCVVCWCVCRCCCACAAAVCCRLFCCV